MKYVFTTAAVIGALAFAGCTTTTSVPPTTPGAPWSESTQLKFLAGCTLGSSTRYCECALKSAMQQLPDEHNLPGSPEEGGITADNHHEDFPGCKS